MTTTSSGTSNPANEIDNPGIFRSLSQAIKRSRASKYTINYDTLPKERRIGFIDYRPKWLQVFNDPKWLLLVLMLFQLSVGMATAGFRTTVLTSIEKRFYLTSLHFGVIVAFYNIGGAMIGSFLALFGRRWPRSVIIGSGCCVVGISYILFALPHFLVSPYKLLFLRQGSFPTCNGSLHSQAASATTQCHDSIRRYRAFMPLFIISQFLAGCGASTLWTTAWDYVEENVSPTASSIYTSSVMLFSGLGPTIGFILGAFFVRTPVDWPEVSNEAIAIDNPDWIGAWWLGFITVGFFLVIISLTIILFPSFLAKYDYYKSRLNGVHTSASGVVFNYNNYSLTGVSTTESMPHGRNFAYRSGADNITDYTHFTMLIGQFLKNKAFMYLMLGLTVQSIGLSGFATFLTKYFQVNYDLDPFLASFIGLLTVVVGFGGAVFLGNIVTSASKISIATISRFVTVSSILGIVTCMTFLFACPTSRIAGINIDYHGNFSQSPTILTADCNVDCHCQQQSFLPICDLNTNITYYSPCYGGCKIASNNQGSNDLTCKCFNSIIAHRFVSRKCQQGCKLFVPFLLGFITLIFLTTLCIIPSSQAMIRCVPQKQRFAVLSANWLVVRLLGAVPGSIIAGLILDSSCIIWKTECGQSGHCLQYDTSKLSVIMTVFTCTLKIISTVFLYLGWKNYGILMFEQDPTNLTYRVFIRRYYSWHFCRLKGDHLKTRLNSTLRPKMDNSAFISRSKCIDSTRTNHRERIPLQDLHDNTLSIGTNTVTKTTSNETFNRISYESNV